VGRSVIDAEGLAAAEVEAGPVAAQAFLRRHALGQLLLQMKHLAGLLLPAALRPDSIARRVQLTLHRELREKRIHDRRALPTALFHTLLLVAGGTDAPRLDRDVPLGTSVGPVAADGNPEGSIAACGQRVLERFLLPRIPRQVVVDLVIDAGTALECVDDARNRLPVAHDTLERDGAVLVAVRIQVTIRVIRIRRQHHGVGDLAGIWALVRSRPRVHRKRQERHHENHFEELHRSSSFSNPRKSQVSF